MRLRYLSQPRLLLICAGLLLFPGAARPQAPSNPLPAPQARIVDRLNENVLVTLRGNTHPSIRNAADLGLVSDSQPLTRMLLLLQRGPDQEAALLRYLDEQQSPSTPNFHKWLTPAQFGLQFGPADADIQAVTGWLQSHGFQVTQISRGRTVIEFSGNAGQVRAAFHAQLRRYSVDGQERMANGVDPQIPAALAPVVAGVVSLNGFRPQPHVRKVGSFYRSKSTGVVTPLFTDPFHTDFFPLAPADFATIYNETPLLAATPATNGAGQTIAVVGESNIRVQDIVDFRSLFGLPQNFSSENIIVNGIDPGIDPFSETESDLDVEWSGAVAPGATIDFITSSSTETTSGTHLSALYAVDNNIAGILSESFGECEQKLGATGNQFYNSLWEQAAAQGITVILSSGDGGSAGCDNFDTEKTASLGLAVSGFASTPFNVAVGGTDFDQVNSWSQYWNSTNDPVTQASARSYIPEIPWNDSCAQLGLNGCGAAAPSGSLNIVAGSGGPSTIYSKPSWQSAPGVPVDNKRDLPDVSLFASNGFTGSLYIICQADLVTPSTPTCGLNEFGFTYHGVGGTSASAPAFAGIMALVNQRQATAQTPAPRQGNANYVLYALAQKQAGAGLSCNATAAPAAGCTFHDITKGNSVLPGGAVGTNSVPCSGQSPNCSNKAAGQTGVMANPANQSLAAWTTTPGYDLVTGLGSVNVQNLVNNWGTITALASTTTLSASVNGSPVSSIAGVAHGHAVSVTSTVTAGTGASGTPSGQVALLTTPNPTAGVPSTTLGVEELPLINGMATGTSVVLPGGTYTLSAHYQGDGKFGPSDSSPGIPVTITPENSKTLISLPEFNATTGQETTNSPTSLVYGSTPYIARVDVGNAQATPSFPQQPVCAPPNCPSGSITLTDALNGGAPVSLDGGTFVLNGAGFAEDFAIQLSGGSHVLTAAYGGDNSYNSSAGAYALTVTPGATRIISFNPPLPPTVATPFGVGVILTMDFFGATPSCNFTFFDGTVALQGTPGCQWQANGPFLYVVLPVPQATAGAHTYSAKFNGDANYAPSTSAPLSTRVYYGTTTALSVDSVNVQYGASITLSALVDSTILNSPALPNAVTFYYSNSPIPGTVSYTPTTDSSGNLALRASITFIPQFSSFAAAIFNGDLNYSQSGSSTVDVNVNIPDFSLSGNSIGSPVTAGGSAVTTVTATPTSNASSPVAFACPINFGPPPGISCSFSPGTVNLANGAPASSTLTILTLAPSSSNSTSSLPLPFVIPGSAVRRVGPFSATPLLAVLACCTFLLCFRRNHSVRGDALAVWFLCCAGMLGCGGGSAAGGSGGGGTSAPTSITLATSAVKVPYNQFNGGVVNLTANISSSQTAGGMVTFSVDGSGGYFVTSQVVSGVAQFQLSGLSVGIHTITARYSGDGKNQSSQTQGALNIAVTGQTGITVQATTGGLSHLFGVNFTLQ
jgi:hypothetical protein